MGLLLTAGSGGVDTCEVRCEPTSVPELTQLRDLVQSHALDPVRCGEPSQSMPNSTDPV